MKRRSYIAIGLLVIAVVLVVWLRSRMSPDGQRQVMIGNILSGLKRPITFYGKAVDQDGNPVPHARVGYRLLDKFMASGTVGSSEADENGNIYLSNLKGIEISVGVRKEGYHCIQDISSQSYAFGKNTDSYTKIAPTKENPALLMLRKIGKTVPLIYLNRKKLFTPANGRSASINLATGKPNKNGLQIILTTGKRNEIDQFDWQYELKIEGGGLLERSNPFRLTHGTDGIMSIAGNSEKNGHYEFIAPQHGYESSLKVGSLLASPKWISSMKKSYFAKFYNGQYALIYVSFIPCGNVGFIGIESYLNPSPEDRNLEPDPQKLIKIE